MQLGRLTGFLAVLALVSAAACDSNTRAPTAPAIQPVSPISASIKGADAGTCVLANGNVVATGFDEFGYNRCAHNFVGTFAGWCAQHGAPADCGGVSGDTRLIMKWNEEWDRGNATNWASGPYDAWLDNEARGSLLDGTSFSEHFKTKWDASCASGNTTGADGGACIWGDFEILMDQGTDGGAHVWWTKTTPAGYGN